MFYVLENELRKGVWIQPNQGLFFTCHEEAGIGWANVSSYTFDPEKDSNAEEEGTQCENKFNSLKESDSGREQVEALF